MAERQKGVQIHRPIIYGSHARLLSEAEKQLAPAGHTHRWTVFLASATSPPPVPGERDDMDYLPGDADDMSYFIKKVTFRLHETYPTPARQFDKPPFRVTETGWGEFTVQIKIQFVTEAVEKPLTLSHPIKLHHWGEPIEGAALPAPDASISAAPTPAPATEGSEAQSTPKPEINPDEEVKGEPATQTSTPKADTATPAEGSQTEAADASGDIAMEDSVIQAAPRQAQPSSIASKYPVHAWQYDEVIFSDPPLAFYNIMNEHPPTPLPARNRRPRDQRDVAVKKKKGRMSSVSAANSRAATPAADAAVPPPATVAPPGAGAGIPGEPGSADVPLEFTAEMEKGEWNKLHEARVKIIAEMDLWRSKLIEEEKELAKLKAEMRSQSQAPSTVA